MNEGNKLISVIVTVYNVEKYMDTCIESIVRQTYKNLEIILVNDGSTDGSSIKCEEWKASDNRIKVIHKENGGAVSARKAGVVAATGDYIGYVDGDDWIELDMYEKMADLGLEEEVDIVSVEDIREYEDGRKQIEEILLEEGIYKGKDYRTSILENVIDLQIFFQCNVPIHGWQHLYKRELLIRNQKMIDDRVRRGEDALIAFTCYMGAKSAALLKQPLYHYRQLPKSARSTATINNLEGLIYLWDRLNEAYEECLDRRGIIKKEMVCLAIYIILWAAYELSFIEDDDKLFPYEVPRNCKIVIVGAGVFGRKLYQRIRKFNFCEIAAWMDNGWEYYDKQGLPVQSIDMVSTLNYDYAIVAVLNAQTQNELIKELENRGVQRDKIAIIKCSAFSEDVLDVMMEKINREVQ